MGGSYQETSRALTCLRLLFLFEFHLRSSPSAFSEYMDISRPADYFIACYTVLTRPNKVETAVHGCSSWLSVWTLPCRCPVSFLRCISLASLFTILPKSISFVSVPFLVLMIDSFWRNQVARLLMSLSDSF